MSEESSKKKRPAEAEAAAPGPARLYALLAGAFLALLGVLGFFYDAEFGTGDALASDDLAGLLNINGWRNVIYIATGVVALAFAARAPRRTALGLGLFYLVFAIWGFDQTDRDIGNLLDAIPLGNKDNGLHLTLGILGLAAALIDGPLPKLPERFRPKKPKAKGSSRKFKAPKLAAFKRKKGDQPKKKDAPAKKRPTETKPKSDSKSADLGTRGDRGSRDRGPSGLRPSGDA